MPLTEGFVEFTAIVEAGSISAAARELGMSRATLHRHLDRLEQRLGIRLLHRTTRSLSTTRAGQELYLRARRIVDEAEAATRAVRALDDTPRGLLRVSVPPETSAFADLLLSFAEAWPEVVLEVDASSRHVDIRADQVDVAIRAGRVRDPDLVGRVLFRHRTTCVASPDYLARAGTPSSAAELADHDLLGGYEAGSAPQRQWPLRDGGRIAVRTRLASNDLHLVARAAARGIGIALLPSEIARRVVPAGALVPVLEDVVGSATSITVVWAEQQFLQPKVRAFVDHVVGWADTHEGLPS